MPSASAVLKLLLLFGHLIGTSLALGAIVATDLRLLGKLYAGRARIAPPSPYVVHLITAALVLLYATGAALVALGVASDPTYLANPKLQGKLLLVLVLSANAVVLHRVTFPSLVRGRPLARWRVRHFARIALPVAVSNSLWLYCAFLGIARPWNHTVPIGFVLETAGVLVAAAIVATSTLLLVAARRWPAWGSSQRTHEEPMPKLADFGRLAPLRSSK